MTDPIPQTEDAREADSVGEKPDLGRTPDALSEALSGTDSGSDTRAGSLRGGSASGSDDDPDQAAVNESLASQGRAAAEGPDDSGVGRADASPAGPDAVENTGVSPGGAEEDPAGVRRSGEADAATG